MAPAHHATPPGTSLDSVRGAADAVEPDSRTSRARSRGETRTRQRPPSWDHGRHDRPHHLAVRLVRRASRAGSARSPNPPPSPSTPRPRRSRRPAVRSSASAPASPTSPPPTPSSRRPIAGRPRPEDPPLHPGRRPARAARSDRREDRARLRVRRQGQPGARHQRRQAGGLPGVRDAARPRRRGPAAGAVLDDLSRGDRARRRRPGPGRHRRVERLPRHGRAARGGAHAAHEGAAVLLAVQPDRRGLPARAGRGDRPLGGRARHLGGHRRDLRAPRLWRGDVLVDAGRRPRARRHLRRRQRRREDLRDDRLARGLDDRAGRRHQGRDQPAVAPDVQRRQRVAARRARRGLRRPVGGRDDARRRSTAGARRWCRC